MSYLSRSDLNNRNALWWANDDQIQNGWTMLIRTGNGRNDISNTNISTGNTYNMLQRTGNSRTDIRWNNYKLGISNFLKEYDPAWPDSRKVANIGDNYDRKTWAHAIYSDIDEANMIFKLTPTNEYWPNASDVMLFRQNFNDPSKLSYLKEFVGKYKYIYIMAPNTADVVDSYRHYIANDFEIELNKGYGYNSSGYKCNLIVINKELKRELDYYYTIVSIYGVGLILEPTKYSWVRFSDKRIDTK